jgi:hypothetical protein
VDAAVVREVSPAFQSHGPRRQQVGIAGGQVTPRPVRRRQPPPRAVPPAYVQRLAFVDHLAVVIAQAYRVRRIRRLGGLRTVGNRFPLRAVG